MSRKDNTLTLSVSEGTKDALTQIALIYGYTWGEKPNVSALIDAIAQGELRIDYADAAPAESPKRAAIMAAVGQIQEGLGKLLRLL